MIFLLSFMKKMFFQLSSEINENIVGKYCQYSQHYKFKYWNRRC
jgi:hypothetical protein